MKRDHKPEAQRERERVVVIISKGKIAAICQEIMIFEAVPTSKELQITRTWITAVVGVRSNFPLEDHKRLRRREGWRSMLRRVRPEVFAYIYTIPLLQRSLALYVTIQSITSINCDPI